VLLFVDSSKDGKQEVLISSSISDVASGRPGDSGADDVQRDQSELKLHDDEPSRDLHHCLRKE